MPGRVIMNVFKEPYPFRLIDSGQCNAFYNMALDTAILESVTKGASLPTLRFYSWKPAAVSIGYFQRLNDEVDRNACRSLGIDIVKRITGGGAVFHQHELTYSIVIPMTHPLADQAIGASFKRLCAPIVEGLRILGIKAHFSPSNDVHVGAKKISGNAQTRKMGSLLQHGTILLDIDLKLMFSLLRVSLQKIKRKEISDAAERVTSLRDLLGKNLDPNEVKSAFIEGFRRLLTLDLRGPQSPLPAEEERAQYLSAIAVEKGIDTC